MPSAYRRALTLFLAALFLAATLNVACGCQAYGADAAEFEDIEEKLRDAPYEDNIFGTLIEIPVVIAFDGSAALGSGLSGGFYGTHLNPLITVGGDHDRKVFRLSKQHRQLLHLPDDQTYYRIIDTRKIEAGLGGSIAALMPGLWVAYFSLMPKIGGRIKIQKSLPGSAVRSKASLALPFALEDLQTWSHGDSLTYTVHGGIYLSTGVGLGIAGHLGGLYILEGERIARFTKIGPTSIQIDITKVRNQSFGGIVDVNVAYAKYTREYFRHRDYTFDFDLSNPKALNAYHELLKRNLGPSLELANINGSGVISIASTFTQAKANFLNTSAGLPIVYLSEYSKKKIFIETFEHKLGAQRSPQQYLAVAEKTHESIGYCSHHYTNHQASYGITRMSSSVIPKIGGQIKFFFERDKSKSEALKAWISKVKRRLGLRGLNPNVEHFSGKSYLRLDISMAISEQDIDTLISNSEHVPVAAHQRQIEHLSEHFLVADAAPERTSYSKFVETLRKKIRAKKIAETFHGSLLKLRQYRGAGMFKEFSKTLALFGRQATKNKLSFRYFLSLVHYQPHLHLRMLGEKIEPTYQEYKFDNQELSLIEEVRG